MRAEWRARELRKKADGVSTTAITGSESLRISSCRLTVSPVSWDYAEEHKSQIAAHWEEAQRARPKLFNGTIFLLAKYELQDEALSGTLVRTDFKSFLYWREQGYPECGMRDAFGAAVLRSSEGHVLLGLQSDGHLNSGLAYPPSGMIDQDDVRDGMIDIDASIVRELEEETGLRPPDFERVPGYILTMLPPFVAIAIEWRSALPAEALRNRILAHVSREAEPELADVVIVRRAAEIDIFPLQPYAVPLLQFLMRA
jgi:8-oxo-dGTP pyrophosphatase MutT (NUDIX family)